MKIIKEEFKIALLQICSLPTVSSNLDQILNLLSQVNPGDIDLICLPENALYFHLDKSLPLQPLKTTDDVFDQLSKVALRLECSIHIGSVALDLNNEPKPYNASVFISDQGKIVITYKKIHLFDISLADGETHQESANFSAGQKPHIFNLKGWVFGESICYDIRFSELYSYYAAHRVDVILIPSSFLTITGKAHWEILSRARAIESQAYVVASAQCGNHKMESGPSRETYGHSLVVDPWGQVICDLGDQVRLQVVTLHKEHIQKTRKQIPMKQHRRL